MNKLLISALALAGLFLAVSCQQENLEPVGGNTVTYSIKVPASISTKAIGDDVTGVTKLIYEVYRADEVDDMSKSPVYEGEAAISAGVANLPLEFVKNQNFVVLFWAQDPDVNVYTTSDLRNVTLSTSLAANNADAAVFAGSDEVNNCVSAADGNVALSRPIAQLNIATSEESLVVGTTSVTIDASQVTVTGLSTSYNVYTKEVGDDESEFVYASAAAPQGTIEVESEAYKYVAMNYVGFAPESGATVEVDLTIDSSEGDIQHEVTSVPVKPNYRTNIIGNLITAQADYNISLSGWAPEQTNVVVVKVDNAADLQKQINEIPEGVEGNITLTGDIDLSALAGMISTKAGAQSTGLTIPADKAVSIDLNGNTLFWTTSNQGDTMIQNNGSLSLVGQGTVQYVYAGEPDSNYGKGNYTINNGGTLTVDGPTVTIEVKDMAQGTKFSHALYPVNNSGTFVLKSGNVVNHYNIAVRQWVGSETKSSDITVEGGEIYGLRAIWIQLPNSDASKAPKGKMTFKGGEIKAWENAAAYDSENRYAVYSYSYGNQMKNVEFVIEGGSFDGDFALTGGRIGAKVDVEKVTIEGGTFNGAVLSYADEALAKQSVSITGGKFASDPSAFVAAGFTAVKEGDFWGISKAVASIGEAKYATLEAAFEAAAADEEVVLLDDLTVNSTLEIAQGKELTVNLNGFSISAVDNTEKNYELIKNQGNLIVKNTSATPAMMTVKATINSGWNRYSAVIANTVGGNLTIEGNVVLEHLGGTDMAYGIDNLTNGKGTYAVTTINGATVKSPYRAVRQFLNGTEATNELYVKAGSELHGDNKSIFFHDPSNKANTGKLVVEEGAKLYGDVYLFVTEGSSEWPVEVSIAASALIDESEVLSKNVPSGYGVIQEDDAWVVVENAIATVEEFKAFRDKINAGDKFTGKTAYLMADIDFGGEEWTPIGTKGHHFHGTFDGQGHTISNFKITQKHDGDNAQAALFGTVSLTTAFKNFNIDNIQVLYPADYNGDYYGAAVIGTFYGNVTLQNINVTNSTIQGNNKVAGLIAHDGSSSNVRVENCNVTGCTIETKNAEDGGNVGGLVGLFQNTEATVKNCSVTGCTINAINSSDSGKRGNALLVGGTIDSGTPDLYVKIENCKVADNTFNETGRVNYVSPYGDGTLVGGSREGDSYVIGKVEIDGVVYPQN